MVLLFFFLVSIQLINAQEKQQETDPIGYEEILKQTKDLYDNQGFQELILLTSTSLKVLEPKTTKDSINLATIYNLEHESYYRLKQLQKSILSSEKGIMVCPINKETSTLRVHLNYNKAIAQRDSDLALKSYNTALEALRILETQDAPNIDDVLDVYLFLSSEEAYYGNLQTAERYIRLADEHYKKNKEALDRAKKEEFGENYRYEIVLLYRRVYLLYSMGETKRDSLRLEDQITRLQYLQRQPDFGKSYESIFYNTALTHASNWFLNKSETITNNSSYIERGTTLIDEVINLVENEGYGGNMVQFKFLKCKALTYANKLDEAESLWQEVFDIIDPADPRIPFIYAQKGLIKSKLKQKDSAIAAFNKSIKGIHQGENELKDDFSNFDPSITFGHTQLLFKIADVLTKHFDGDKGVQEKALRIYYLALSQLEYSFIDGKFNIKTDLYLKKIITGILTLRKKGYGLNDANDKDLLNRIEIIRNQNEWKRFNQSRYTNNLADLDSIRTRELELRSALVGAKREQSQNKQDSLNNIIRLHKNKINEKYPNLELLSSADFSISNLQVKLEAKDLIIKYLIVDDELITFIISKNDLDFDIKPWLKEEQELLNRFLNNLKQKKYSRDVAEQLYELLIPELESYKNIIINPDKELFKLPFEALSKKKTYLFENFNVRYTSNLGFIRPEFVENQSDNSLVIYAPSYQEATQVSQVRSMGAKLEGAEEEAQIISTYFDSKIYDSPSLSKYDFINTSSKAKLLHLAMHAEVNNKQPELSKLLFASGRTEDNDLYLEEIYGLNLSADMAVLSACNTGVGKENSGRSLESFQRAFTFAGVPATVASLWEVPDLATKEIMINFYDNLKGGQSKASALNNAKLDYKTAHKNTKLAEPYYWAGFVLYGDNQPIASSTSNTIIYIGLAVLLIGLGFVLRKRNLK